MRKTTLLLALIIFSLGYFFQQQNPPKTENPPTSFLPKIIETAAVARVIDGDTIVLQTGEKVRYIGMDTPELKDKDKTIECLGREAFSKNKELVEGKEVRLEKDVSETDRYGRLLRYVYVDNIMINDYLVREGFAYVSTFPPDVKYQKQFLEAEKEAKINQKGLWGNKICS